MHPLPIAIVARRYKNIRFFSVFSSASLFLFAALAPFAVNPLFPQLGL